MKQIETEISIQSPPERVWQVLTDFERHGEWNPFIKRISGEAKAGATLTIFAAPPGSKGMTFKPVVLRADAPRAFRWKGKLGIRGIFDGEHYFHLESEGTGTRFIHGEHFGGILVPLLGGMLADTEKGFRLMNDALKKRCEEKK